MSPRTPPHPNDLRTFREDGPEPEILLMLDAYLLDNGWTVRSPRPDTNEEANYGDSVYVHPGVHGGRARGWVDAVGDQADLECSRLMR